MATVRPKPLRHWSLAWRVWLMNRRRRHPATPVPPPPAYTPPTVDGGDVYDVLRSDGRLWRVHEFATSGELTVTDLGDDPQVRLLLVGGGGSGGSTINTITIGGSGAGGSVIDTTVDLTLGTHPVLVGSGGAAVNTSGNVSGVAGSPTTVFGLTALGGGFGGAQNTRGGDMPGGNGGGAGGANVTGAGGGMPGGSGDRKGGDSADIAATAQRSAGGGAGAGGPGGDSLPGIGGDGGPGVQSDISGEMRWYGVGAAGSCRVAEGNVPGTPAPGGSEGVIAGQPSPLVDHGTGNGGCGNGGVYSGHGGDGILYLSYPLEAAP